MISNHSHQLDQTLEVTSGCAAAVIRERAHCGTGRPVHGTTLPAGSTFLGGRVQYFVLGSAIGSPAMKVVVDGTPGPRSWSPPV